MPIFRKAKPEDYLFKQNPFNFNEKLTIEEIKSSPEFIALMDALNTAQPNEEHLSLLFRF
jgi:hypothetical protein